MSRIGSGDNVNNPDKKCIGCKYWQNAGTRDKWYVRLAGKCTAGYCKKYAVKGKVGCK